MAFFCTVSGARIAAPGVSKAVDPVNGQDEYSEAEVVVSAPAAKVERVETIDVKSEYKTESAPAAKVERVEKKDK
jgi:hypothetical protein